VALDFSCCTLHAVATPAGRFSVFSLSQFTGVSKKERKKRGKIKTRRQTQRSKIRAEKKRMMMMTKGSRKRNKMMRRRWTTELADEMRAGAGFCSEGYKRCKSTLLCPLLFPVELCAVPLRPIPFLALTCM